MLWLNFQRGQPDVTEKRQTQTEDELPCYFCWLRFLHKKDIIGLPRRKEVKGNSTGFKNLGWTLDATVILVSDMLCLNLEPGRLFPPLPPGKLPFGMRQRALP